MKRKYGPTLADAIARRDTLRCALTDLASGELDTRTRAKATNVSAQTIIHTSTGARAWRSGLFAAYIR